MPTPVNIVDQTLKVLDKIDKKAVNNTPAIDPRISGGTPLSCNQRQDLLFQNKTNQYSRAC